MLSWVKHEQKFYDRGAWSGPLLYCIGPKDTFSDGAVQM